MIILSSTNIFSCGTPLWKPLELDLRPYWSLTCSYDLVFTGTWSSNKSFPCRLVKLWHHCVPLSASMLGKVGDLFRSIGKKSLSEMPRFDWSQTQSKTDFSTVIYPCHRFSHLRVSKFRRQRVPQHASNYIFRGELQNNSFKKTFIRTPRHGPLSV